MSAFDMKMFAAVRRTEKECRIEHARFTDQERKTFRRDVLKSCETLNIRPFTPYLQLYFIMPINIGGSANVENCALIMPDLKERFNNFICSQLSGLRTGEKRNVIIPFYHGHKVWVGPMFNCKMG